MKGYYRFGDLPEGGKSAIWFRGEEIIGYEDGVSVYECYQNEDGILVPVIPMPITEIALDDYYHHLMYFTGRRYFVQGERVGTGTNGEPLIKPFNAIEIKDGKINV